ncbi:MAG: SGNH/GDSL hydrolase family protein [Planctomycetota bacterium]
MMTVKIKNNESILFIGDSITDCGRRDVNRPLGNGYVKFFNDFMIVREPAKRITIINKGIGGNTIKDLQNRWYDDVLRHKPDWLSIKIGINDLHRYMANTPEGVSPEKFMASYDDILSQIKKKIPNCKILLIDPFYISNEKSKTSIRHDVLNLIPEYISVVRNMHQKYRTRRVETHALFSKLLKYYESDTFCPEPVHPNCTGHLVIAEAVYSALSR